MPKPFPADKGTLAEAASDFLSTGTGDRIPGAGWSHPTDVYWQDAFIRAGIWKAMVTFSHLSVTCSARIDAQNGWEIQYTEVMMHNEVPQ